MSFDFMNIPLWLRVIVALLDYLVKAAVEFKDTPEGAKEWDDFTSLYEQSINNDANDNVEFGVEAVASPGGDPKVTFQRGRVIDQNGA